MIVAAIDPGLVTAVAAALLGGGLLAGIGILRKSGPEAEKIVADTLIQVNQHLREELERRDKEWEEQVERRDREIERLRQEVNRLRGRLDGVQKDLERVETELGRVGASGGGPPERK
jgi:peptidoglycan hydrolase CwlO-like protein